MDIDLNEHGGEHDGAHAVAGDDEQNAAGDAAGGALDIEKLTAKVYRLMLDDLRLEQARAAMRNR